MCKGFTVITAYSCAICAQLTARPGSMGLPDDRSLRASVTTFAEQLGRPCPIPELEQALLAAFSRAFGITLVDGPLSDAEARQEHLSEVSFSVE